MRLEWTLVKVWMNSFKSCGLSYKEKRKYKSSKNCECPEENSVFLPRVRLVLTLGQIKFTLDSKCTNNPSLFASICKWLFDLSKCFLTAGKHAFATEMFADAFSEEKYQISSTGRRFSVVGIKIVEGSFFP